MRKRSIDLNSDMGEGFGPWTIGDGVDDAIMPLISSANIATGFHAGDPNIMNRTVLLAREHGVCIGAHPGFAIWSASAAAICAKAPTPWSTTSSISWGVARIRPPARAAAAARETAWRAVHAGRA